MSTLFIISWLLIEVNASHVSLNILLTLNSNTVRFSLTRKKVIRTMWFRNMLVEGMRVFLVLAGRYVMRRNVLLCDP